MSTVSDAKHDCPRCTEAAGRVKAAGFKVSAASWHSDERCYAASVQTHGPSTYGHPKAEAMVRT